MEIVGDPSVAGPVWAAIELRRKERAEMIATKDAARVSAVYNPSGSILAYTVPIIPGRDMIVEMFERLLAAPGCRIDYITDRVIVARSGELAIESGRIEHHGIGIDGAEFMLPCKYLTSWVLDGQGQWFVDTESITTDV